MEFKMIPRGCFNPFCDQVFKVMPNDYSTKFHSSFCEIDYQKLLQRRVDLTNDPKVEVFKERKNKKCLDMVNSETMEKSGMEDGELRKHLKKEKEDQEKEKLPENIKTRQTKEEEKGPLMIQHTEKSKMLGPESSIENIKLKETQVRSNGQETIPNVNSPIKGNIMQETSLMASEKESMKTDSEENHSGESRVLSTVLKEEKESSIQSLNESSKLLTGLAKSLTKGKQDDEGEFIQKPMVNDVEMALRCLEGARNIQKTKLDFLKFGFEVSKQAPK